MTVKCCDKEIILLISSKNKDEEIYKCIECGKYYNEHLENKTGIENGEKWIIPEIKTEHSND